MIAVNITNYIDITGVKFGKWKVIRKPTEEELKSLSNIKEKHVYLFCKCECGHTQLISRYYLKKGKTKQCKRCSYKERSKKRYGNPSDIIGKKFGEWTVVKSLGIINKANTYICKCNCGTIKRMERGEINQYEKSNRGCTKCGKRRNLKDIFVQMYLWVKRSASTRNKKFTISKQYCINILNKQESKCAYTGIKLEFARGTSPKSRIGKTTASIDRINNSKGYIPGNIQWVHKDINFMKQSFDHNYFIELCRLVAENHPRK